MDNTIVIFGSAITCRYRKNTTLPNDIDVIYTGDLSDSDIRLIEQWSLQRFGVVLPIDAHKQNNNKNYYDKGRFSLSVPVLCENNQEYIVLKGKVPVDTYTRTDGFASTLRLYGSIPYVFRCKLDKLLDDGGEQLALLPPNHSYRGCGKDRDKYFSGLQAFRNAMAHCDLDILDNLNCTKLLRMLLHRDPDNWVNNPEVRYKDSGKLRNFGVGYSLSASILINTDITAPVMEGYINGRYTTYTEDEAIKLIFNN